MTVVQRGCGHLCGLIRAPTGHPGLPSTQCWPGSPAKRLLVSPQATGGEQDGKLGHEPMVTPNPPLEAKEAAVRDRSDSTAGMAFALYVVNP